jgi:hypothetical protein
MTGDSQACTAGPDGHGEIATLREDEVERME